MILKLYTPKIIFCLSPLLLPILTGCLLSASDHALYIGLINIDHSPAARVAQIRIRVFNDDLENALKNTFSGFEAVGPELVCESSEQWIQNYFEQHLAIKINGKKQALQLVQCLIQNDIAQLSFESKCAPVWKEVNVQTDIFQELFPTQSNVIQLSDGEEKRFARLNLRNQTKHWSF